MTFHDCIQPYSSQKSAVFGLQQKLSRQKQSDLPGGTQLWFAVAKVVGGMLTVIFFVSFLFGSYGNSLQKRITNTENTVTELSTTNVALLAERAMLVKQFRKPVKDAESLAMQDSPESHVIKINKKIH